MSELRADDPVTLGEYRLSRRLGQGGQGVVFLASSPGGAQVAVKLLHASLSGDPDVRRRFLGEADAVRRVAAFCTAQLLDADLDGDRPYLVSEYVDGPSLGEHVIAKGPRLGGSLDRLAIGTATALGAIHRAGVIHRDFKPGNVLLSLDGPRVIDFGVSRLMDAAATTTRFPIGTPAYLAPERIHGESAGAPSDLWAWALTVAYTATGRHAYIGDTYQEILARILYGKPDLSGLSGRLREIVDACLAHEPGDRPDAEEVLRRLLGQDPGLDPGAGADDVLSTGVRAAKGSPQPDLPPTTDLRAAREAGLRAATAPTRDQGAGAAEAPTSPTENEIGRSEHATAPAGAARVVRRLRSWHAGVALATVAVGVTAFILWPYGAQQPERALPATGQATVQPSPAERTPVPSMDGTWAGSAEHPTAKRVFPVELRLHPEGASLMRWGADLHCSGRLGPAKHALEFTLDQVKGEACYPGTLRIVQSADPNQIAIEVTREGTVEVTYAGKLSRDS
ncbi:serine/threonine protein kinase [Nonomuraea zeae]|uniref:Serine/threonine protein kinase n=1 Tax=Nonomuraea zeae TaxID=1642303 RepID=A0A5S4HD93_9ACTN|nr:serine/threonine-protein kinase [Nonomuraea zeae]TMR36850.1 serine/threonine protein kinase [Nonomuraea zeae]